MTKEITEKNKINQGVKKFLLPHHSDIGQKRICECGNFVEFVADEKKEKGKINRANFCKYNFCVNCMWRKSIKEALMVGTCMAYITDVKKYEYIMLGLTAKNVKAAELPAEIARFNKAFAKLCKRKEIIPVNKGYVRKLEVTYDRERRITADMYHGNKDKHIYSRKEYYQRRGLSIGDKNPNYDTYHPHFHALMAVNKNYFTGRTYLSQDKWLNLWRSVMQDETITQVDVRRVYQHENGKGNAVNEVAKYAAKSSDYAISQKVFDVFYNSLKGRQVLTFNAAFKDAVAKYKTGELNDYKPQDVTDYVYKIIYAWLGGEYLEKECITLTDEEKTAIKAKEFDK